MHSDRLDELLREIHIGPSRQLLTRSALERKAVRIACRQFSKLTYSSFSVTPSPSKPPFSPSSSPPPSTRRSPFLKPRLLPFGGSWRDQRGEERETAPGTAAPSLARKPPSPRPKWSAKSGPDTGFRRLSVLQANKAAGKVVTVVQSTDTSSYHVMKETSLKSSSSFFSSPSCSSAFPWMHEFLALTALHRRVKCPGIIDTPEVYETKEGATMIYPMHPSDLFNYLDHFNRRGISYHTHRYKIATTWLAQLLFAVKVQIDSGVVHTDLKLENILLDRNGNAVICDYELARLSDPSDPSGNDLLTNEKVTGTPMYVPPELALLRCISRTKSDLWAIGVIAWELVADSNPWDMEIDAMSERQVLGVTNQTRRLRNFEDMPEEYFQLIRGLVCPVHERMSVEEAMALKMFSHIDFNDMDKLFPRGGRAEPRKELGDVVEKLKVMNPMAFQNHLNGEKGSTSTGSFFSEDLGEEEVQPPSFGRNATAAIGKFWTKTEGKDEGKDDSVPPAAGMRAREKSEAAESESGGENGGERERRQVMDDWLKKQDLLYRCTPGGEP